MLLYIKDDTHQRIHALVIYRSQRDSVLCCDGLNLDDYQEGYDDPIFQFWSSAHPHPINVSPTKTGTIYYGVIPNSLLENSDRIMAALILPSSLNNRFKTLRTESIIVAGS